VAIGVPDDILGEKVGAVVSLREQSGGGVTEDILLEHVKTRYVLSPLLYSVTALS
jgi:hypothetical protein